MTAASGAAAHNGASAATAALDALHCTLSLAPAAADSADQLPQLQVELRNDGRATLQLLRWGTPFEEAWLARWARVERDGQTLEFQGAMLKRGQPQAADHVRLAPGRTIRATLPFAPAYDIAPPGLYRVTAIWMWQGRAAAPGRHTLRPFAPTEVRCPPLEFRRP